MKEIIDLGKLSLRTRMLLLILCARKKLTRQKPYNIKKDRAAQNRGMKFICGRPCRGVNIETVKWGEDPAHLYTPEKITDPDRVMLYLHGGAYTGGSIDDYAGFVTRFAKELGIKIYSLDYPLAPERPFPHALKAATEFYTQMIAHGADPKKIIIAGDSAGASLALAAAQKAKSNGTPLPALFCLFSPWADLTDSNAGITQNADKDLMLTPKLLDNASKLYCGTCDPRDPLVSPLFADYTGFPPIYLLAADNELLYSQIAALHEKIEHSGTAVRLTIWKKTQHAFVVDARLIPETAAVFHDIKNFIANNMTNAKT